MPHPSLILASSSPRRRELLTLLGIPFQVAESDVEERRLAGESPQQMAMRLSLAKAVAATGWATHSIVIACDTIVVLQGEVLGKPADPREALLMLHRLRGREHTVYSGLTMLSPDRSGLTGPDSATTVCDETTVRMRAYSNEEMMAYVASGDPLDKAGAYAIQHPGFHPVALVEGCYTNVMGLPLRRVARMLRSMRQAVPPDRWVAKVCADFTGHACCLMEDDDLSGPCCAAV